MKIFPPWFSLIRQSVYFLSEIYTTCIFFKNRETGTCGITEAEARKKYGDAQIKIYQSNFTPLYHALTTRKQMTRMKLVCAGPDEKVVGLHMIGRGCDEMLQVK